MNKWLDPLTTAWIGVVTHKLRSFLAMLGIVIGVAAVIALMSVAFHIPTFQRNLYPAFVILHLLQALLILLFLPLNGRAIGMGFKKMN